MKIKNIKVIKQAGSIGESLAGVWGKAESAMLPKPIRDMVAEKLRDIPDEQLDGAMDNLLARLNVPKPDFVKAALKKYISEIRRKDTGREMINVTPEEPQQLGRGERLQLDPAKPMPKLEQIETSNKQTIKLSKSQWEGIGKKAGWMKKEAAGTILKHTLMDMEQNISAGPMLSPSFTFNLPQEAKTIRDVLIAHKQQVPIINELNAIISDGKIVYDNPKAENAKQLAERMFENAKKVVAYIKSIPNLMNLEFDLNGGQVSVSAQVQPQIASIKSINVIKKA